MAKRTSRASATPGKSIRARRQPRPADAEEPSFSMATHLKESGVEQKTKQYRRGETVFAQGDDATDVCFVQSGAIKLSVLSRIGKEAVVAMLASGDFFGEGTLAGQIIRIGTATAVAPSSIIVMKKKDMAAHLHASPAFADHFLAYMLARNIRVEADLVDQLFNSSERRLARTLLLLARYGEVNPQQTVPKISQETLAEMIGTTRSRVNFFMNKFRKLGLIEYNGTLKVNPSLLNVVLHD